jgi:hypothetical protein
LRRAAQFGGAGKTDSQAWRAPQQQFVDPVHFRFSWLE